MKHLQNDTFANIATGISCSSAVLHFANTWQPVFALALALVGGPDSAKELQKKVATANVRAAASEFGMQTQMDAEELAKMGVTRADARAGYMQSQQEMAGLQAAQQQFGGTGDIAKELENVNVLGKSSTQIKRLKSQARGQFAGSTGIAQGSLSRRRTGQL